MDHRAWLVSFLFLCCFTSVSAQTVSVSSDAAFGRFMTEVVGSGQQTVSFATGGQAIISTASGRLALEASGTTSVAGKVVPVVVKAAPVMSALASGLIATAKVFGPVGVGLAIWNLYSELGIALKRRDDGTVYGIKSESTMDYGPWVGAYGLTGAIAYAEQLANWGAGGFYVSDSVTPEVKRTYFYNTDNGHFAGGWVETRELVEGARLVTLEEQQLIDEVAQKSGWPTSSALKEAARAHIASGKSVELDEPSKTITGPATTTPKITTRTLPDGTTETTTEKSNLAYQGNKISVSNSSTVKSYNPVTNTTTTTSETTTENPDQPPSSDLCEKNPEILACQKLKLGELKPDKVPDTRIALKIDKDDGWGPASGSCPEPKRVTILGTALEMPFTLLCDFATAIRPLLVGFAYLSAALGFLGLGRKEA